MVVLCEHVVIIKDHLCPKDIAKGQFGNTVLTVIQNGIFLASATSNIIICDCILWMCNMQFINKSIFIFLVLFFFFFNFLYLWKFFRFLSLRKWLSEWVISPFDLPFPVWCQPIIAAHWLGWFVELWENCP